jgi:hypothetical protein
MWFGFFKLKKQHLFGCGAPGHKIFGRAGAPPRM